MIQRFTRTLPTLISIFSLAFAWGILFPLTVMAEPNPSSCQDRYQQIEESQQALRSLEQHEQQLQQHVRGIYQELFACHTGSGHSTGHYHHCTQLEKEGPKQFQAMITTTTLKHQKSQQLAQQTRQVQLNCPIGGKNAIPKTTVLLLSPTQ